jgi:exonuclease III
MKIITWNIRGLNNPRKNRILRNRLRKEQPDLCFIQQTKCTVDRMETIEKKKLEQVQDGGCRRTIDGRRDPHLVELTSDEPNSS